ncbi:Amidase enhancer [Acaryochloris thomasi RCC1774]|uniref:Amidase enhancer n=1 Tax=Acaryochloris thomasi RCC1774 TaxID=1764569 RepID=A0A2W1JC61_9CYAN|nr:SpoIID/LytB domain-containing protein [Acaryochloris thomasi]PZD71600.1 Amidase enhancer [Acaryochloris thomasi RCC1774]
MTGAIGKQRSYVGGSFIAVGVLLAAPAGAASNPTLKIGIVQRFGEQPKDTLTIQALPGDRLTLKFADQGQVKTLATNKVQFDIQPQPLPKPVIQERVVLGVFRSFESAETQALDYRMQGIPVEVAQPNKWQVWAKRDRYSTPKKRKKLVKTLKEQGKSVFLDQQRQVQKPLLSWVVDGYRYSRDSVSITSGKSVLQVQKNRYGGTLKFQPNTYGSYTLVNQVPIETYLRGVVPYEIGFSAPLTSIQAQAIIARTYALRNLRRFKIDDYELCADTQCQVYRGLSGAKSRVDDAIATTAGQVLTYDNELIDALYSSTTGGVTASFEEVWEGDPRPYLQTKIDAAPNPVWDLKTRSLADPANFKAFVNLKQGFNEVTWPTFRWRIEAPLAEMNQILRKFLRQKQHPLAEFGTIQTLEITKRSHGGRVQTLRVTTDIGSVELHKDEIVQGIRGAKSLLFYVEPMYEPQPPIVNAPDPQSPAPPPEKVLKGYRFVGGGWGHAVGLSQTGAQHLSKLGWSASKILDFYYPGTTLEPLTDTIARWREPEIPAPSPAAPEEQNGGFLGLKLPQIDWQGFWEWLPFT